MAYTLDQYNTLVAAIAQGALMVVYGNKTVTYKSTNDMLRIKAQMEIELGLVKVSSKKILSTFNKGLQ